MRQVNVPCWLAYLILSARKPFSANSEYKYLKVNAKPYEMVLIVNILAQLTFTTFTGMKTIHPNK